MQSLADATSWFLLAFLCLPPVALITWAAAVRRGRAFEREIRTLLEKLRMQAEESFPTQDDRGEELHSIPEGNDEGRDTDGDDDSVKAEATQRMSELPACVQEFFSNSVRDQRRFRLFTLRHVMQIRLGEVGKWKDLPMAEQRVCVAVPAFVFTGSMRLGPGFSARGYESLVGGEGKMHWKLLGAYTIAEGSGLLMSKAARARWLAEAVCYPQALLPSEHLRWESLDKGHPNQARAILDDGRFTVSCVFKFGRNGKVLGVETEDYARLLPGGRIEPCTLRGTCNGHMLFGLTAPGQLPNRGSSATSGGIVIPTDFRISLVGRNGAQWDAIRTTVASVRAE